MSHPRGNWRNDPGYDYFDDLPPEQIAFEFLRRDGDYEASYAALSGEERVDQGGVAPPEFSRRWGLRFCSRSDPAI